MPSTRRAEEFTKLERKLDADDRERMAKAVQAAEAIAPTRPHPGVESAKANFARRTVRFDAGPGPRSHRRGDAIAARLSTIRAR